MWNAHISLSCTLIDKIWDSIPVNLLLCGPGETFLTEGVWACESWAEPDAGLFMSLIPHRVPDSSHPCQHQSQIIEFPCMETLVITVYYFQCLCHYFVSWSSVPLLDMLWNLLEDCTEEFQGCWYECVSQCFSSGCLDPGLTLTDSPRRRNSAFVLELFLWYNRKHVYVQGLNNFNFPNGQAVFLCLIVHA